MIRTRNQNILSNTNNSVNVYFDMIDPKKIFGMVGRCGGGHNTVWSDWTNAGRLARHNIINEFEKGMNKICGHYVRLEQSILENGMLDPVVITCGWPIKKKKYNLPPEIVKLPNNERLLLEGSTGGSRLWVAQKYNIPVPCIINDFTGNYKSDTKIRINNVDEAKRLFIDVPKKIVMSSRLGIDVKYDDFKRGIHLKEEWSEDNILKYRAPLWVSLMNDYGYYVSGLSRHVEQILLNAGVVQSGELKDRWEQENYNKNMSCRRY